MLIQFWAAWDGHLSLISTIKHKVDVDLPLILPIHSVPCRPGPEPHVVDRIEIKNVLAMNVINIA